MAMGAWIPAVRPGNGPGTNGGENLGTTFQTKR